MKQLLIILFILFSSFCSRFAYAESSIFIHADNKTISAPASLHYTWYFNGIELTGHNKELSVKYTGLYTVVYQGENGPEVKSVYLIVSAKKIVNIFLMGDSTVSDYTVLPDYQTSYPLSGWGEHLKKFLMNDSLYKVQQFIKADSVIVRNRAIQGNSTRTYWRGGHYNDVKKELTQGDYVFIQFGHNDEASCSEFPDRCVSVDSFKIYLNWYIDGIQEKGAIPVLITPMVRSNWANGMVYSDHGAYPDAMKQVGAQRNVPVIDLTQMSINFFDSKGQAYVNSHYFMIFPAGTYPNYKVSPQYPNGSPSNDNTHFRVEGAFEMARLVFKGLQALPPSGNGSSGILVFPNPARDKFTIRRDTSNPINFSLVDSKGSTVLKRTLYSIEEDIDISWLAKGLYIIVLDGFKQKLIIQ